MADVAVIRDIGTGVAVIMDNVISAEVIRNTVTGYCGHQRHCDCCGSDKQHDELCGGAQVHCDWRCSD